jgi:hypothetical protein
LLRLWKRIRSLFVREQNRETTVVSRPEDQPRTLIFVDMLGFAELTRRNPTRILEWGPDENGFTGSGTTELQSRVGRFQHVIDSIIRTQAGFGGVSGQVFSDCAYVDVSTSLRAVRVAVDLMREFINMEVPVRMGLGRGTYYSFKHSIENTGTEIVTKALFAGTAVVNAYDAEQCGGKGCRILVHPSVESDLTNASSDEELMPLPEDFKSVRAEVCYLPQEVHIDEMDSRYNRKRIVDQDLLAIRHVEQMMQQSEPMDDRVRLQYTETLAAVGRMRKRLSRGTTLEEAALREKQINDEVDAAGDQGD